MTLSTAPSRVRTRAAALAAACEAATGGALPVARQVRVAGRVMRLEFSDGALFDQVMPAFAHLEAPSLAIAPDLTVHMWSSVGRGPQSDPPILRAPDGLPPGAFLHHRDGPVHVSYQPARRLLNVYDERRREAWFWVGDGQLPYWERSAPLRHILHWWMSGFGIQQLHSSAVGDDRAAVLVVGRSGSGKSTTALACLSAGLGYLGDDYVLVSADTHPQVFSIFCSGKLTASQLGRLPELLPAVRNSRSLDTEKALVYVPDLPHGSVVATRPLAAVLVPVITGEIGTRVEPLRRAAAVAALAPSTLGEVFTADRLAFQRMRAIVEAVPCFSLLAGRDLPSIGPAVRHLLDELHGVAHEPSGLGHPGRPQR